MSTDKLDFKEKQNTGLVVMRCRSRGAVVLLTVVARCVDSALPCPYLNREIAEVTQECDTIELEKGAGSFNYKLWIKHLYRLINIKHQMSPSEPGLALRLPL